MNVGIADRLRSIHRGSPGITGQAAEPAHERRFGSARLCRLMRWCVKLGLTVTFAALNPGAARAQAAGMLDTRVTQQAVAETICRPGYAEAVSPPLDELMAQKTRLLTASGIDGAAGIEFALDRHVPIVLGGSPDAPANLGLLPWFGPRGERRKSRAAVMLKHCVCEGKTSLADAQATIIGNGWGAYAGFGRASCDISHVDAANGGESEP